MSRIFTFVLDEKGVTSIEYAIIASLIAVVIFAAVSAVGNNIDGTFESVSSAVR